MHGAWCGAHIGPGGLSTLGLGFYDPHVPPVSCVDCSMQLAQLASAQLAPPGFFSISRFSLLYLYATYLQRRNLSLCHATKTGVFLYDLCTSCIAVYGMYKCIRWVLKSSKKKTEHKNNNNKATAQSFPAPARETRHRPPRNIRGH